MSKPAPGNPPEKKPAEAALALLEEALYQELRQDLGDAYDPELDDYLGTRLKEGR